MPDVIVVGDIDTDNFYIVPALPGWDEGILVNEVYECSGGKGANTASTLSQYGISTGIIAAAGDDHYGKIALEGLKRNSVENTGVTVVPGGKTYYCIMMLDPSGEKAILVVDTGMIYPTPEMMKEKTDYLLSAKHAHFIGIEPLRMAPVMQTAKEAGLTVSVDLDAAYQGLEACQKAIQWADVVLINQQGAKTLYPDLEYNEMLIRLVKTGPSTAIITRGKNGVIGYTNSTFSSVPAFDVNVKDTTGAGDVFAGSFIYGHLKQWDLQQSLKFASAAAALSVAKIGGQSALPTVDAVKNFLSDQDNLSIK